MSGFKYGRVIRKRMNAPDIDKLTDRLLRSSGNEIERWRIGEQQLKMAVEGLKGAEISNGALEAKRI